ncbi:MAG: hypothetical protein ACI4R8_00815 [Candidatus Caccovivens sp.]
MINIFGKDNEKKNKYHQRAFDREYLELHDGVGHDIFSMEFPSLNCKMSYRFERHWKHDGPDTEEKSRMKLVIELDKKNKLVLEEEDINSVPRHLDKLNRVKDLNKLVEMVSAYAYAEKHLDEMLTYGNPKKEFKHMSAEDLKFLTKTKEIIFDTFKMNIKELAMGNEIDTTGQDILDFVDKGYVNVDELVNENIEKNLANREKQTERQERIEKIKNGFVKIGKVLKLVPNSTKEKNNNQIKEYKNDNGFTK